MRVARDRHLVSIVQVDEIHPRKLGILTTLVAVLAIAVLAVAAAELINYGFGDRITALDAGSDEGVFGTAGDIALAAAALSAWVLAARSGSARPVPVVLAGLLTFLAVDNIASLHDHIPHWLGFYLPVLAAAFICLVVVARSSSEGSRFWLIGAGLLLLALSLFLHVFGMRLLLDLGFSDTGGWAYQIKAVVKHGTEVAGWFLVVLGLLQLGLREPGA